MSTPLHAAAEGGHTEICRLLLEHGAKINARDSKRNTALHLACRNNHVSLVELLRDKGADISIKNKAGKTAKAVALDLEHRDAAAALSAKKKAPEQQTGKQKK